MNEVAELNNPTSPNAMMLRARSELAGSTIVVKVQRSHPAASSSLFDVELHVADAAGGTELYQGVTIGEGAGEGSLTQRINTGTPFGKFSQMVKAEELSKGDALTLPRGDSAWSCTWSAMARGMTKLNSTILRRIPVRRMTTSSTAIPENSVNRSESSI